MLWWSLTGQVPKNEFVDMLANKCNMLRNSHINAKHKKINAKKVLPKKATAKTRTDVLGCGMSYMHRRAACARSEWPCMVHGDRGGRVRFRSASDFARAFS